MHSLFEWHIRTISVGDPSVLIPRKKQIPIQKNVFRKRGYDPWRQDFTNIAQLKNRKQHLRQSVRHTESPNPHGTDGLLREDHVHSSNCRCSLVINWPGSMPRTSQMAISSTMSTFQRLSELQMPSTNSKGTQVYSSSVINVLSLITCFFGAVMITALRLFRRDAFLPVDFGQHF